MSIEAPLSRYKKQNLIIFMVLFVGLGLWFYYDGYHNESFIEDNTVVDEDGNERPNATLLFNQTVPPFLIGGAALVAVYFVMIRNQKLIADESALHLKGKTVDYDAVEKIDKTHFDRKGFFVLTYKDPQGRSRDLKLSDRTYDNLSEVLDHVVAKIC